MLIVYYGNTHFASRDVLAVPLIFQCRLDIAGLYVFFTQVNVGVCCTLYCHIFIVFCCLFKIPSILTNQWGNTILQSKKLHCGD